MFSAGPTRDRFDQALSLHFCYLPAFSFPACLNRISRQPGARRLVERVGGQWRITRYCKRFLPRSAITTAAGAGRLLFDRVNSEEPIHLRCGGKEAGIDGVDGQLAKFFAGKALLGVGQQVLVGQIGAEEGRVVGVERDQQARSK